MPYIFTPTTTQELKDVVDDWCRDKAEVENNFGHISNWNTGRITNMQYIYPIHYESPIYKQNM